MPCDALSLPRSIRSIALTGGHPSTIAPTDAQWLSPYVVTLNSLPNVDMVRFLWCGDVDDSKRESPKLSLSFDRSALGSFADFSGTLVVSRQTIKGIKD